MAKGIMVFGLNGSGKSTLGKQLAEKIGFEHMDIENYYFPDADIPYSVCRSREECVTLMEKDIQAYDNFVLTAVTGDFGMEIEKHYILGVYLGVSKDVRLERVIKRSMDKFGDRVKEGGDMFLTEQNFIHMVKSRSVDRTNRWADSMTCPVVSLDGTKSIEENVDYIINVINGL